MRHLEFVDVGPVVVLGIGDRRLQHLADDYGAPLGIELQDIERVLDRFAANEIGHQTALLCREPHAA
ncbi:hypothetical protein D3C83_159470 [compost metagenome]